MALSRLWLLVFPILFFQNFGRSISTPMGVLGVADIVIWPYLGLVILAFRPTKGIKLKALAPILGLFFGWALLGVLTIPFRYEYISDSVLMFSLLKILKIGAFGLAGVFTCLALMDQKSKDLFEWSLLVTGLVISSTFIAAGGDEIALREAYGSTNSQSVSLAMLFCYIFVRWMDNQNSSRWHTTASFALCFMAIGMLLSNGRGGWLAVAAGLVFIFFRRGMRRRLVIPLVIACLLLPVLYQTLPGFQYEVDKTFFPENLPQIGYEGTRNVGNIDDGGRFERWSREGGKFLDAPLFGAGYFHRGETSGLTTSGSHNYFIQVFLETGIVGGGIIVTAFYIMWRDSGSVEAKVHHLDLPVKSALVAAIVGGLGGEYFYGGTVALLLFALYAPVGSLTQTSKIAVSYRLPETRRMTRTHA